MGGFNLAGLRPGLLAPGGTADPTDWNGMSGSGAAATPGPQGALGAGAGAPGQLAAEIPAGRQGGAAPAAAKMTGAAAPADAASPLGPEAVRNIVFNETQSLNGDGLPSARTAMALAIMNADKHWGSRRDAHAKTERLILPPKMNARQQQILGDVQAAVANALALRAAGTDVVHGSTNYNLRENASTKPPWWAPGFTSERVFGPFPDNLGKPKYIDIWHNPQGG